MNSREGRNGGWDKYHVPVIIVDKVTETGGVDDSKAKTNTILLNV
jgi:hypothetical protein